MSAMDVPTGEPTDVPVDVAVAVADDAWLSGLYRDHYRSLVRLAYLLLGDRPLSEEVVQEAFVRVHLARRRIRDGDRALPYLRSAVLNGARSQLRRLDVRRRARVDGSPDAASAESGALAREDSRRVVAALRALPVRQRECLALRYYLDLSEAEIAEALGISAGSVKTHAHRGMATLAATLGEAS